MSKRRIAPASSWAFLVLSVSLISCSNNNPTGPATPPKPLAFSTFQAASLVIGQTDMTSGDGDAGGTIGPVGIGNVVGAPALAPSSGPLYLVDNGHARVVGYRYFPSINGKAADFVIGQPDFTTDTYGRTASKFLLPNRCDAAHGHLFLSDYGNSRVLIWNSLPTSDTPADVVIGKPDFTSNESALDASHLSTPQGVMEAGGKVYVLDGGHNRLLIWNSIPTQNGQAANLVVGQTDFTTSTSGLNQFQFGDPRAFWTDGTRLVICDWGNHRVLIWNHIPTTNGADADVVVGAPDFTTAGSSTPSATAIRYPTGVTSDGNMLAVADYNWHRVLIFDSFPTSNGASASQVLGQNSFTNVTANDDNQDGVQDSVPTARTLFFPADVRIIGRRLLVADQDNNRVLVFQSK